MMSVQEIEVIRKRNRNSIRELIRVSFGLGVNLTAPTMFKEALRIVTVLLLVSSCLDMYSHWGHFMKYKENIPDMIETICTALQTAVSIVKLFYYLFTQYKFYLLLNKAQTHEVLQKLEIFDKDFAKASQWKNEINAIMDRTWREIRIQLIMYVSACTGILCNYTFYALFKNAYHAWKQTPNYEHILPFIGTYLIWEDKGMSFPYYEIEVYLSFTALYIAAMAAVSFEGILIVVTMHSVGLINVLKFLLSKSTSEDVPPERRAEFMRYCINHYDRTVAYIDEIQSMFQHVTISQFVLSLIILGFVLFKMKVGLESDLIAVVRMLMYMSAAGSQIVIYCYNGQRLTTASEGIPLAFYNCDWYNESEQFKQLVYMMLVRTDRYFKLDISWFSTMSLPTLLSENDKNTVIHKVMYISAAGYEVIIYCYNGQRLATASEGIPGAFYNCEWYNESREFKRMLQMMILRTNRTFYFDISWFTTMALPTLVSLMRTSGSYFLLLRNLSE